MSILQVKVKLANLKRIHNCYEVYENRFSQLLYSKTPDEQHPILQNKKCCSRGGVAGEGISNVELLPQAFDTSLTSGISSNKLCSFALVGH